MLSTRPTPYISQVIICAEFIERIISEYGAYRLNPSSLNYIHTYPESFLNEHCPQVAEMPAAFIVEEGVGETLIGIHINSSLASVLNSENNLTNLLSHRDGLNAFLILSEEISHFHHYIQMLNSQRSLSRFDLELQAELDKVVIASLALKDLFGHTHLRELIKLMFDQSIVHGTLTDYEAASKIAEKFWKENLTALGPGLFFDEKFRRHFHKASRLTGTEKLRHLDEPLRAA